MYLTLFLSKNNLSVYSSNSKISSMFDLRALATLKAKFNEGLYFPCSKKTIVSRRTSAKFANSSWVIFNFALSSLILFFIKLAARRGWRWKIGLAMLYPLAILANPIILPA